MRISDWSSDVCSSDLRMREDLGIDHVVTAFGMTEAVVVTMCRDDDSAETVATTCGRAIPGMETRIGEHGELLEIGRAACRERVYQDVLISVGAVSLKKKTKNKIQKTHKTEKTS